MNNRKTATVAVINRHNQLLILRRGKTAPWMPGRYCLPGGHVEPDEDSQYAAVRELSEETGISYPVDQLTSITIQYLSGYSKLVWVAKTDIPKVLLNYEHDDYRWINYCDMYNYELVPRLGTVIRALKRFSFIL